MRHFFPIVSIEVLLASVLALSPSSILRMSAAPSGDISVLMLGDNLNRSGHAPEKKAEILIPAMATRGITVTYTNEIRALNAQTLATCDCLLLYNNIDELPPTEEKALLDFVESGKGLVVVHCAAYAFRNSEKYVALVGAQFASHGNETFRAQIIDAQHPAMRGLKSFEATDESYVHTKTSNDRRVLMIREHQGGYEPWTWVRKQGQGRVFYTASGHSEEVWRHADFQKLIEQGVRWTAGRLKGDEPALDYVPARVPRYVNNAAWGTSEEQTTMQAPLPPADSLKHMHLPEGFRVELFASEPQIIKPISMNFDERGRLWVIESIDYPNTIVLDPHLNGHDRIKICEDTDGDGRADKFTIFADRLNCPTSLVFARGGVIVTVAPHILFLKDTNGDDVADLRQILYTGLGRADTHAVASNLHYGPDNWVYGSVGYSGGKVQVGNATQTFRMGLFRFRTDGSAFEVLTTTSNNTWGFGFDESGDIFASTANNEHAIHLAIPNRYFEAVHGWHGQGSVNIGDHKQFHPVTDDVRQVDVYGGYTAASGFEVYTARSFPESFWDRTAFVCEPTGHLVHLDKLVQQGSEFIAHDGYNLLASSDAWTAPIAAQVGPDSAVWMIDWYNYIVQHNPTPHGFTNGPGNAYSTPLRDKEHGRIYRLAHEQARPAPKLNLDRATPQRLVETLANDNFFWRLTAQRLLVDRGQADVAPALGELVTQGSNPQAALHALRTLDGLGWFAGAEAKVSEVLRAGLANSSPGVRRAALAVLPRRGESVAMILKSTALQDSDALVRKDALLTLAEMPGSPEAGEAIAAMLNEPRNARDRWIPLAAISAAARNDLAFLKAVARIRPDEQLLKTLAQAASIYAEHYARGGPVDSVESLISALRGAHPQIAGAVIAGLATGWPMATRPAVTSRLEEDLRALIERLPLQAHLQVASLANRWGSGEKFQVDLNKIKESLLVNLGDVRASEEERATTARQLVSFSSDQATIARILDQVTPQTSLELGRGLLDAFGQSSSPEIATAFVDRWSRFTPAVRAHVLSLLLQRPDWTKALLDAIGEGKIPATDLSVQQSQALLQNANPSLARRAQTLLSRGGRLPSADRQKMLDALLPLAKRRGDINQGRLVFEKNCASCHRFAGTGTIIGPDLTGIAAGNREEILLNILDPNRSVEANFRQFQIETKDGRSLSGLIVAETKAALELLESQGQRQVLQRSEIGEIRSSELSLMPEGFETLPAQELVSLLDYLTERSGFFPISLRKVANVITTKGMFSSSESADRMVFDNWEPKAVFGVPFHLIDPRGDTVPNAVVLHGPHTVMTRERPKSVSVPCNAVVKGIHLLSGVSGWGYPTIPSGSVSMIVRFHYADGASEEHPLTNGVHFADYIRRVDVPESRFAFTLLGGQQLRSLKIFPQRWAAIDTIEFIKGPDDSVPVIMAVTAEGIDAGSRVGSK